MTVEVFGTVIPLQEHQYDEVHKRASVLTKKMVSEAVGDIFSLLGAGLDPYDSIQDLSSGWQSYPIYSPAWYRQSQKRGELIPVYLDEWQLRFIRDRQRKLHTENPFVQCAVDNFVNYAVGEDGLLIKAVPSRPDANPRYAKMTQRVLQVWQEANDMPEVEADMIRNHIINGEDFTRHFEQESGLLLHRPVEAELIRSPTGGAFGPHQSFGIQCDPEDILKIEGYWVVVHPIDNQIPTFVEAEDITHFKTSTPRTAKRGLSLFYSCELLLRHAMELLRGVVTTANIRARYAVIKKYVNGVVKEAADKLEQELAQFNVTDPKSGNAWNVNQKPFGSVTTLGPNQELEFPDGNMNSSMYEVALQMVLRAIAARCNFPEWMLTADASNANMSSTMISEAPSTRSFGRLQKSIVKTVVTSRAENRMSMAWRQVQCAVRAGLLPPEAMTEVSLTGEGPSLVVRDKTSEAMTNEKYMALRVKPRQMVQQELGIDSDKADAMFEEDDAKQSRMQMLQQVHAILNAPPGVTPPQPGQDQQGQQTPGQPPMPGGAAPSQAPPAFHREGGLNGQAPVPHPPIPGA